MLPIVRERIVREHQQHRNLELVRRRLRLRAESTPFDLPDQRFVELFRLNKRLVQQLIELLRPRMVDRVSTKGITLEQKVFCTLRFYAVGAYQRGIGQDFNLGLSQTTAHRCIHAVTEAIVTLVGEYITFPTSVQERNNIKYNFMHNWGFPGTIGAIDCFHVAILEPHIDEHNFINRKGYHSINVQVICDNQLKIRALFANFVGSTHDSLIWRMSSAQTFMQRLHNDNESSWLIGDSGYPLQPYLLTPYRNAQNEAERRYNYAHVRARNCIERTIGLLKMRFRCLHKERSARYSPEFICLVTKACAVLHNMCIDENVLLEDVFDFQRDELPLLPPQEPDGGEGAIVRQTIVNRYFL